MTGDGTRITAGHLVRAACVYVRQSTPGQVRNNLESKRLQYALQTRAKELGWHTVETIDEDLGRSGGGGAERPGFQKLLTAVCESRIGIVLSVDASRLARNGREWHTLLEFCAVVGCLLGDGNSIYDPALLDDRLLLGMKGSVSEMGGSVLRQRSHDARRQKAARGELFLNLPAGYVKAGRDAIAMEPDQRVRDAIRHVYANSPSCTAFAKCSCGSAMKASSFRSGPFALVFTDGRLPGSCRCTTRSTKS